MQPKTPTIWTFIVALLTFLLTQFTATYALDGSAVYMFGAEVDPNSAANVWALVAALAMALAQIYFPDLAGKLKGFIPGSGLLADVAEIKANTKAIRDKVAPVEQPPSPQA